MINGASQHLTPAEQEVVSRWAAKTAVMFFYATSPPIGIDAPHRAELFQGRIPPNTGVWLACLHVNPPEYNSWNRAREIEMRRTSGPIEKAQAMTLTLGYYVQQVLFTPANWFALPLVPAAPPVAVQFFTGIPQHTPISWPPAGGPVTISDLEKYADRFSATGVEVPGV
jgi:hypothetical protein